MTTSVPQTALGGQGCDGHEGVQSLACCCTNAVKTHPEWIWPQFSHPPDPCALHLDLSQGVSVPSTQYPTLSNSPQLESRLSLELHTSPGLGEVACWVQGTQSLCTVSGVCLELELAPLKGFQLHGSQREQSICKAWTDAYSLGALIEEFTVNFANLVKG